MICTALMGDNLMRANRSAMPDKMRVWLYSALPEIKPKSKLGEALAYLHKYWPV